MKGFVEILVVAVLVVALIAVLLWFSGRAKGSGEQSGAIDTFILKCGDWAKEQCSGVYYDNNLGPGIQQSCQDAYPQPDTPTSTGAAKSKTICTNICNNRCNPVIS